MELKLNKRKALGVMFLSFLVGIFLGRYILTLELERPSADRDALFVKKCGDLNGKDLTFANLKTLEGHIGLTEDIYEGNRFISASYGYSNPFEEEYFNQYLKGEYINDSSKRDIRNRKVIRVFDDNSFIISENGALEGNWKCRIKPDTTNSKITTTSQFVPFYFFD